MTISTITLTVEPTTLTAGNLTFNGTMGFGGGDPDNGNYSIWLDGLQVGSGPLSSVNQSFTVAPGTLAPGTHTVYVHFDGINDLLPCDSNMVTLTVQGTITSTAPVQAISRPIYTETTATGTLTRTQIENGEQLATVYVVSGIRVLQDGSGYDANSVATLTQGTTRETLTITLGDGGGIASLSGFNPATQWADTPKVTITRWTAAGVYVPG